MILSHPAIEILTTPRGGAVQIIRFLCQNVFEEFCKKHLLRRRLGPWASLELALLKHEDAQEEVLILYGQEPELHIHGGEANFQALIPKLNTLGASDFKKSEPQTWQSLWDKNFRQLRGEKAMAYMLSLKAGKSEVEPYDQEGWEYLRPTSVCLVGPPNAGKSTFFNELLGESRALVSHLEGTTRDLIQASIQLDGWEILLTDTAGFNPDQLVENGHSDLTPEVQNTGSSVPRDIQQQSIALAIQCIQQSDIILAFRCQLPEQLVSSHKTISVYSKCEVGGQAIDQWPISVHHQIGLDALMNEIKTRVGNLKGRRISPIFDQSLS